MRLHEIPDVLREFDLEPVEVSGWQWRGREYPDRPEVAVAHHTVGAKSGDYPSLGTVRDGRPDVPGPLANLGQGRYNPWKVYVIASGISNNAGRGSWRGWAGNPNTIGAELEHTGYTSINQGPPPYSAVEYWDDPAARMDAHLRLCAAMLKIIGRDERYLCAHFEWAPGRKVDPRDWQMAWVRHQSGLYLQGEHPNQQDESREDDEDMRIKPDTPPCRYIANVKFAINRYATDTGGALPVGWMNKTYEPDDNLFVGMMQALDRLRTLEPDFNRTAQFDMISLGAGGTTLSLEELREQGIDPAMVSALLAAAALR